MNQLENFDESFVHKTLEEWRSSSETYQKEAEKSYNRLRSYLTLYQFRIDDDQKCRVREKISQTLDEIESNQEYIRELDSYLSGYCFRLDKSILPCKKSNIKPAKVEDIQTAAPSSGNLLNQQPYQAPVQEYQTDLLNCDPTLDCTDLDYYTLQFFQ